MNIAQTEIFSSSSSRDTALAALSDDQLVSHARSLCVESNRLLARIVVVLIEIEERRLHARRACSSMFDFCRRRLGMSQSAAFRRTVAAQLVRRFPSIFPAIERGAVCLSHLVRLREHLDANNVDELVAAVCGKTTREVKELLARRAPRPDVPADVRLVPVETSLPFERATPPSAHDDVAAAAPAGQGSARAAPTANASVTAIPTPTPNGTPSPGPHAPRRDPAALAAVSSTPARIEPSAHDRYAMQLTIDRATYDKLERARELLGHACPRGELASVVDRALDALIDKLEKDKRAKTSRPQKNPRPSKHGHVPAAVIREVFARDGDRCTYVDETTGERCSARARLELDHIRARARGGGDDVDNLRVRCRLHNELWAEECFGKDAVAARIAERRAAARRYEPPDG